MGKVKIDKEKYTKKTHTHTRARANNKEKKTTRQACTVLFTLLSEPESTSDFLNVDINISDSTALSQEIQQHRRAE